MNSRGLCLLSCLVVSVAAVAAPQRASALDYGTVWELAGGKFDDNGNMIDGVPGVSPASTPVGQRGVEESSDIEPAKEPANTAQYNLLFDPRTGGYHHGDVPPGREGGTQVAFANGLTQVGRNPGLNANDQYGMGPFWLTPYSVNRVFWEGVMRNFWGFNGDPGGVSQSPDITTGSTNSLSNTGRVGGSQGQLVCFTEIMGVCTQFGISD